MQALTKVTLICLAVSFIFIGCDKNPTTSAENGTLRISLTDAPAQFEAVNITFSEISAHIDGNWIVVVGDPVTLNLLEWNNGKSIVLGAAGVPAGQYTQIRIKIDSAKVVFNGATYPVTVPSGSQTGLKLIAEFMVAAGSTFELILDFDACRSVVTTGPPNNPNGFILKPTIRVVPMAITGSISGLVINPENSPVAYAIAGSDTVTSTSVDINSGEFMLAFLPEGLYTVSVRDAIAQSFEENDVGVVVGSDHDLGVITLQ